MWVVWLDKREKTINKGANGIISIITHIESGEKLAWKEISIMDGEEEKVKEEARLALSMESPFLVPIVDSFVDDGKFYIVMPFFEKGTLATLLAEVKKSGKPIEEPVR
jgi:serine/threonine protein kinase